MIVISQALALSAATLEFPLTHPIIGWHSVVTPLNVTATSEHTAHPASNLANTATYLRWQAEDETEQFVTVDTGFVDPIDYVGIAAHNFGSDHVAVSVQWLDDDTWVDLVESFMPADDTPLVLRFPAQSIASIRVRLQPDEVPPRMAVLQIGHLLVMERSVSIAGGFTPFPFGREADILSAFSQSGNFLGRIILNESRSAEVEFDHIRPTWFRANVEPFLKTAISRPFFFAWNPADHPLEVGFAWLSGDAQPRPVIDPVTSRFSLRLRMAGIAA